MTRFLTSLLALLALAAPALAQTRALPPGEIRANGDITFGNALKLGKREGNKTTLTPDSVKILGSDSEGEGSGFCAKLPELGACRKLSDRARDTLSVMDAPGVVCNGQHDDTAGIQQALNVAIALQGTVGLPRGRTCAISATLIQGRAHLLGGGTGSALIPLVPMAAMVKVTNTLSSIRDVSFVNQSNRAQVGVRVETPIDALHTFVERNYFTGFPTSAIVHDNGHHLVVKSNVGISNANFIVINNNGVNDVIEDNYSGPGGSGITFQRLNPNINGTEGAVVRGNVIFAWGSPTYTALKVTSNIDIRVNDNTFESDCVAILYDGIANGVSYIHHLSNWIGSRNPVNGQKCAALTLQNQVKGFTSINDIIVARGQQGVLLTATGPERPIQNATFVAPLFQDLVASEKSSIDLEMNYVSLVSITGATFSGPVNVLEGPGVVGRIDSSTFTAIPQRNGGLAYGKQTYMPNGKKMLAVGSFSVPAGQTSVNFAHGLAFQPDVGDFTFTPFGGAPSNGVQTPLVAGIDANSISLQFPTAPSGSALNFGWKADISR